MIRIRVSYLESLRRCVDTEWGDESELARAIRGNPYPPNWMMEAGTAWHELLEDTAAGRCFLGDDPDDVFESNGYSFSAEAISNAVSYIGPGLWEVPGSIEILPGISLEGKADHVRGLVIQDQKTKFSTSAAADYEASLQWRAYLVIHGAERFRYNLWRMSDPKDGYCKLRDVLSFNFCPYAGLREDVTEWVKTFLDWASTRNLLAFLERDPYREAA